MKTAKELYDERIKRISDAITLKKPDRVPVITAFDTFAAAYKGVKMSKFSTHAFLTTDIMLETLVDFPEFDASEFATSLPKILAAGLLCKIKLAGKELPEGSPHQIDERERLTHEDYDTILKIGWTKFKKQYWKQRINFTKIDLIRAIIADARGIKKFIKAGIPVFSPVTFPIPTEPVAAGRSMPKFMIDLHRMPDKMQEVLDVVLEDTIADVRKQIKMVKPFAVFLACARVSSQFISPKMWERFAFPYIKKATNMLVEEGVFVNLHLDSDWTRDIDYFKELPKGKCVFADDSSTDIFKLKKALDGHMCIKGDVAPSLLALGTPDEVHKYCVKLVKEIGPTGFILAPGCTLPMNAKVENVKAMLTAVTGR